MTTSPTKAPITPLRQRTDRFQTMGTVLAALDAAEVPGASGGRWPRWWPLALLGVLLLAALLGFLALRSDRTQAPTVPVAAAADPVARARDAIDAALPSVSCTWLRLVSVTPAKGGVRVALTGVAGNPTGAQAEIARTLQGQGMAASAIDFADVSPITQSGCAALDAYRQIRATGRNCGSAWKKDPGSGVIGVEKGPLIPVV